MDNNVAPIFIDPIHQSNFDENGYIKIKLFDVETINHLKTLFYNYHSENRDDFFGSSSYLSDFNLKKEIGTRILNIITPFYDTIFKNYDPLGASFLYKTKGKNSALAPHQDWTIVDEKKDIALNVWIPLVETNNENGTLFVVPKTHSKFLESFRSPTLPFFFEKLESTILSKSIEIKAEIGDVIILNESLIHFSSPNNTNDIRIAITAGVTNKGAKMHFLFYDKKNKTLETYDIERDFLISFENFFEDIYKRPNAKIIDKKKFIPLIIHSKKDLIHFLENQEIKQSNSFLSKIINTFNH